MNYTVEQAMMDWNLCRWEVVQAFRKIDASGVARFIIGRKGHPSRLVRA